MDGGDFQAVETKTCTKCGQSKSVSLFSPAKRYADGLNSWCRLCKNIWRRENRKDNPARESESNKKQRERMRIARLDPDKNAHFLNLKRESERRLRNDPAYRDMKNAQAREKYRTALLERPAIRERINARNRERRALDPEYRRKRLEANRRDLSDPIKGPKIRAQVAKWRSDRPALTAFLSAKARAKKRNLEFDLTREWVFERGTHCELSGVEFSKTSNPGKFCATSISIDKIDSNRGYTKDNCRVVCMALNCAFSWWGSEAFEPIAKAWLNRLANAKVPAP